jgi:predicted nucleic acid-binding protein
MYIDTSALVKLYVEEPDSGACETVVAGNTLVSSRLLYCEFRSALVGKVSRGIISSKVQNEVWREFEADMAAHKIRLISISDMLVQDAAELMSDLRPNVYLRTLDALHLATFLSVEAGSLFTMDLRMFQAAKELGLSIASTAE